MNFLILAATAGICSALPSYIAVPSDQIAFLDLRSLHTRFPRQTLSPPPPPQALPIYNTQQFQDYQQIGIGPVSLPIQAIPAEPPAPVIRHAAARVVPVRPPDFGEYVDFGAHTGDNGAFGWYADYPLNQHHSEDSYRK